MWRAVHADPVTFARRLPLHMTADMPTSPSADTNFLADGPTRPTAAPGARTRLASFAGPSARPFATTLAVELGMTPAELALLPVDAAMATGTFLTYSILEQSTRSPCTDIRFKWPWE